MREGGVAAARVAARLAEQRPAAGLGERDRGVARLDVGDVADHHDAAGGHDVVGVGAGAGEQREDLVERLRGGHPEAGVGGDGEALARGRCPAARGRAARPSVSSPSGTSGSRNATLRCTGPGRPPRWRPRSRARRPCASSAPGPRAARRPRGRAASARCRRRSRAWSMVWLAPVSRSSAGRSAVSAMIGTPAYDASTIAARGWPPRCRSS